MNTQNQFEPIIGRYTLKNIKEINYLSLKCPLSTEEINNLKYLKNGTTLNLRFNNELVTSEGEFLLNVIEIFKKISKLPYKYNIILNIDRRELLRQSEIIPNKPANINLSINSDDYIYSLDDYINEENKLQQLIEPIKKANLSPFEKYLAVYDIVKNYKPFNNSDPNKGRELRQVLDDNNPNMVCSGYVRLLNDLLAKVNIPSKFISLKYDISSKQPTIPLKVEYKDHSRNLIKIDDDKYNIHGIYLADTTWNNHPNWDLYTNSILTFDRKKEAELLESLQDEDLLLDFHNLEEFREKIKYFIKKRISHPKIDTQAEEQFRIRAYKELYIKIMDILFTLDKPEYKEFHEKYNNKFSFNQDKITSSELEPLIKELLKDYAKYIIPLSNNKVEIKNILSALIEVKRKVYGWNDKKIKEWLNKTIKDNLEAEKEAFPYKYDPNNKTEAYLESRYETKENKRN